MAQFPLKVHMQMAYLEKQLWEPASHKRGMGQS